MDLDKLGATSKTSFYLAQQQAAKQLQAYNPQRPESAAKEAAPAIDGAVPVPGNDNIQLSAVTLKNVDTIRAVEQMHERMNQQIRMVRATTEELNKEATKVEQMSTNLNAIIKNFPPFPVSSKERQEQLMSYTSLRQEIMKLMVPTPPQAVLEQVGTMWQSLFDDNGQILPSAVPALDTESPDPAIKDAAATLKKTGQSLADMSSSVTQTLFKG